MMIFPYSTVTMLIDLIVDFSVPIMLSITFSNSYTGSEQPNSSKEVSGLDFIKIPVSQPLMKSESAAKNSSNSEAR